MPLTEKQLKNYQNPDNDSRGCWNSATYTCNKSKEARPSLYYPILNPNTGEEVWPKETAVWAYSKEQCEEHIKNNLLYWGVDGKAKYPRFKKFLSGHQGVVNRMFGGSLYQAEEDMNQLEQDLVMELTALPNIRWWHRNIVRQGFAINGFINHYPDIMLMTNSGKVILVETKGDHLKNDDSRDKIELGRAWRNAAGNQYRYYMVFRDGDNLPGGAVSMSQFIETLKSL